jgi:hypothetical protein
MAESVLFGMERPILGAVALSFVLAGTIGLAAEPSHSVNASESWKLVTQTKDVAIYSRPHSGSSQIESKRSAQLTHRLTRFM